MTKRVGRRSPTPTPNPRGGYRSPFPYPPTTVPYPARNRSAEIITISLLVAAFMLLGLGGMLWLVETRTLFGPTPTPTATQRPPLTSTPDLASTRVAEDFLTQEAYRMALLGTTTSTPRIFASPTHELPVEAPEVTATPTLNVIRLPGISAPARPTPEITATFIAEATLGSEGEPAVVATETVTENVPENGAGNATPTQITINLPIVADNSPLATSTPALVAEVPTTALVLPETSAGVPTEVPPTALPEIPVVTPTESETPTPTPTLPPATPTPTDSPTPLPPTPTATAIPPGQPFTVASLQGSTQDRSGWLHLGPSNIYTAVVEIPPQTAMTILKRNGSGEWLQVCCIASQPNLAPMWMRQAYVRPHDNPRQSGAPEDSNPNDVRWLQVEAPPQYLPPLPTAVPPGADDFPLARYDRQATGRVDQLPIGPTFSSGWGNETGRAGGAFVSPVAVMGQNVIVDSADNHLYSFDRLIGSQRWRFNFCDYACTQVNFAPAIYDGEIFLVSTDRTVWSLQENFSTGDSTPVKVLWRVAIDQFALSSFNVYSETLFLATGIGADHKLLALDRDNGAVRWSKPSTGLGLRYPAVGDQLVYAADGNVTAYDVNNGEQVWVNEAVNNVVAGPVYGAPGISALAELFAVTDGRRIFDLDANTGVEMWNIDNGEPATSLALNQDSIFVAGDGYIKAISRQDRTQRWRTSLVGGQIMGGPLVDGNRVVVVTKAGNVYLLDSQTGAAIVVSSIASYSGGDPAVSGPYIFVPGYDGRLYNLLSSSQ